MANVRKVGAQYQGVGESIAYQLDMTNWTTAPTGPTPKVYDESNASADVTTTVMPAGSASVSGATITLPLMTALTLGHVYRVEVAFTGPGSNVPKPWFEVICER
jgi:hypothetical protein